MSAEESRTKKVPRNERERDRVKKRMFARGQKGKGQRLKNQKDRFSEGTVRGQ